MTDKDWILLLIPIIANGILLAIFQEILKRRFEKIDQKRKIENKLNKIVFDLIQKYNGIVIASNRVEAQELLDQIDLLGQELFGLQSFIKSYNILQKKYEDKAEEILNRYNNIVEKLKDGLLDEVRYEFYKIEEVLKFMLNKSIC